MSCRVCGSSLMWTPAGTPGSFICLAAGRAQVRPYLSTRQGFLKLQMKLYVRCDRHGARARRHQWSVRPSLTPHERFQDRATRGEFLPLRTRGSPHESDCEYFEFSGREPSVPRAVGLPVHDVCKVYEWFLHWSLPPFPQASRIRRPIRASADGCSLCSREPFWAHCRGPMRRSAAARKSLLNIAFFS